MSKVILSGYIMVAESDLAAVHDALPVHIAATRAETGCLVFNVNEHKSELGRFDVYEEFDSSEAFKYHQQRVRESEWGTITKNVERHYKLEGFAE